MVHALEKAHQLLVPGGLMVDIHPSGQPPPIVVRLGEETHLAGWLREEDDYVEYAQADAALNEVVVRGLFRREARSRFTFTTHAATVAELRDFLARTWEDAIIDDGVALRATELLQSAAVADKEVILREPIKIARLGKQGSGGKNP
jgi:hypothetical protein